MGHDEQRRDTGKYLGDAVYGALDGIITTFAIVAGVAGASLSSSIILVLGLANLLADGVSMAAGNYLSKKSEIAFKKKEQELERRQMQERPAEAKAEVVAIYKQKGFRGPLLNSIVKKITGDEQLWVREMMGGHGMADMVTSPWKAGLTTFIAFLIAGSVPLVAYVAVLFIPSFQPHAFAVATVLTLVTIFAVGSARAVLIARTWWKAGTEMLLVGGGAAFIAYVVGALLKNLA
ncbi:MAG: VIT1/CCC1 transporter family protein [Candidatus Woesearchaeota archaeon]|nr:VIT1/CCC1 transporter family protein [Candidatus Woesearchaeota archaeon]